MQTAEDLLNHLLANSCSNVSDEEGYNEYHFSIESHCSIDKFKIIAKCINREQAMHVDEVGFKYQIKSIEKLP